LTALLLESGARVVAIEFDRELVSILRERFGGREEFKLVEADALEVDFCTEVEPAREARVVANLPYNISTAMLQRLVEQRHCLREFVLMLQREVVERITAQPGESERGYLTVLVEAFCESEALFDVPPDAFRPVPKVWSTVARLRVRDSAATGVDERLFTRLVSACFAQKRKTIFNNLRSAPEDLRTLVEAAGGSNALLEAANVDPRRRAESLTIEEWAALAKRIGAEARP
jgi:16S rRNA (adenine1518-N6/adenine1519-N6)-dimethyltransferase